MDFKRITGRLWMAVRADNNILLSDDGERYGASGFPHTPKAIVIERADVDDLVDAVLSVQKRRRPPPEPGVVQGYDKAIVDIARIEVFSVGDWCELTGQDDDGQNVKVRLQVGIEPARALGAMLYRDVRVTVSAAAPLPGTKEHDERVEKLRWWLKFGEMFPDPERERRALEALLAAGLDPDKLPERDAGGPL